MKAKKILIILMLMMRTTSYAMEEPNEIYDERWKAETTKIGETFDNHINELKAALAVEQQKANKAGDKEKVKKIEEHLQFVEGKCVLDDKTISKDSIDVIRDTYTHKTPPWHLINNIPALSEGALSELLKMSETVMNHVILQVFVLTGIHQRPAQAEASMDSLTSAIMERAEAAACKDKSKPIYQLVVNERAQLTLKIRRSAQTVIEYINMLYLYDLNEKINRQIYGERGDPWPDLLFEQCITDDGWTFTWSGMALLRQSRKTKTIPYKYGVLLRWNAKEPPRICHGSLYGCLQEMVLTDQRESANITPAVIDTEWDEHLSMRYRDNTCAPYIEEQIGWLNLTGFVAVTLGKSFYSDSEIYKLMDNDKVKIIDPTFTYTGRVSRIEHKTKSWSNNVVCLAGELTLNKQRIKCDNFEATYNDESMHQIKFTTCLQEAWSPVAPLKTISPIHIIADGKGEIKSLNSIEREICELRYNNWRFITMGIELKREKNGGQYGITLRKGYMCGPDREPTGFLGGKLTIRDGSLTGLTLKNVTNNEWALGRLRMRGYITIEHKQDLTPHRISNISMIDNLIGVKLRGDKHLGIYMLNRIKSNIYELVPQDEGQYIELVGSQELITSLRIDITTGEIKSKKYLK
ncbi:MAG: hypothetical protein LBF56_01555 [Holosporales bacterium]|jgi:hypothetical protein|nr:hypothetical protein [Holosporales bacterium]